MIRRKFASFAIALSMTLLSCLILEGLSRIYAREFGDALVRARRVLKLDAELGWRGRENLDTVFEGRSLRTDDSGFRTATSSGNVNNPEILVLGPSSSFGWGVEQRDTWAANLGPVKVLNASEIGYSLEQGRKLYASLTSEKKAKTVILAFGVNDVDRFRFYGNSLGSDADFFESPHQVSKLDETLQGLVLTEIFIRASQEAFINWGCHFDHLKDLRSSVERFSDRLKDFILQLKTENRRVVLATSAYEFPFTSDEKKAAMADEKYAAAEKTATEGSCRIAREFFLEAKQNEPWRVLRDIDRVNERVRQIATESRIPLADLASQLHSVGTRKMFVDPIHPSEEGHRAAALLVRKALQ